MITASAMLDQHLALRLSPNFRSWQRDAISRGILPVIAVTGSRGKSTLVRMLDAIFQTAHLRTATWTNQGVEIRNRRQRGELSGWSLALSRLAESTIDIAIQELHWSTINAVGLPESAYPVAAVTNVLGPRDPRTEGALLEQDRRAGLRMVRAVHPEGLIIINGDDPALVDMDSSAGCSMAVISLSEASPAIREHLKAGGAGGWQQHAALFLGEEQAQLPLGDVMDFPVALDGAAPQQISNLLTAATTAYAVGVDIPTIVEALQTFRADPEALPGSFNVFERGSFRAVVDHAGPSSLLRPLLRAINPGNRRRQITVIGDLTSFPPEEVHEIGRLLGRHPGAIIVHSNMDPGVIDRFRRGIASNPYPPVVIHLPTERRALNRALKTVRSEDVLLVLCQEEPAMAIRALSRYVRSDAATAESAG